jgi:hypothetical protein
MPSLPELLTSPESARTVVDDCLKILDEEVASKRGLSGMGIKAGFKVVRSFKPGFLRAVVTDLVPEFARALDPLYQEALADGAQLGPFLERNRSRVANALLAITDAKASRSDNGVIKGAYDRLRSTAIKHVEAAVPRLGGLIEKHAAG